MIIVYEHHFPNYLHTLISLGKDVEHSGDQEQSEACVFLHVIVTPILKKFQHGEHFVFPLHKRTSLQIKF